MLNIKEYLYNKISTDPTIISLVGDKVYPGIAPEGTPNPCITYQRIGGNADQRGVNRVMYQISVRGKDELQNEAIVGALGNLVNRLKEPPIKYMYIERYGDDTWDVDTKSHGTHLTIIITYLDSTF